MHYKLDLDKLTLQHNAIVEEINEGCCKELNTDKAFKVPVNVGDFVVMNDHQSIVSVIVVSLEGNRFRVMDRQGFFHDCERWMYCECTESLVLRSLVAGVLKSSQGYSPTEQKKLKWSSWADFFSQKLQYELLAA